MQNRSLFYGWQLIKTNYFFPANTYWELMDFTATNWLAQLLNDKTFCIVYKQSI